MVWGGGVGDWVERKGNNVQHVLSLPYMYSVRRAYFSLQFEYLYYFKNKLTEKAVSLIMLHCILKREKSS